MSKFGPEPDGHVGPYMAALSSTKAKPRRRGVCVSMFEVTLSCDGSNQVRPPRGRVKRQADVQKAMAKPWLSPQMCFQEPTCLVQIACSAGKKIRRVSVAQPDCFVDGFARCLGQLCIALFEQPDRALAIA
jgi:hypothetical protein